MKEKEERVHPMFILPFKVIAIILLFLMSSSVFASEIKDKILRPVPDVFVSFGSDQGPEYAIVVEKETKEIGLDRHFISYDNGIVIDSKTGIEWIAGPDKDTTWDEARSWVDRLTVEGGDWRMPTREELRSLYEKGIGTRNMTPLLKTTGWWIWSGVKWGISSARVISFYQGLDYSRPLNDSGHSRGFAVRFRKR
jgi:hypothetical protein